MSKSGIEYYLGVDPGLSGACCLIDRDRKVWLLEPFKAQAAILAAFAFHPGCEKQIKLAAIERVHAMPKQGVTSMFRFGKAVGWWEGLLSVYGVSYISPTPREWQKEFIKPTDGNDPKERSLTVARRLFPDVDLSKKSDHNKADALLLALYAMRWDNGGI
jgi:crossover junction endodeoxyribonuclease RuvC